MLVCGLMAVGSTSEGPHLGLNAHGSLECSQRMILGCAVTRHRMVSCCSSRQRWIGLTARSSRMGLCCSIYKSFGLRFFTEALDCDHLQGVRER